MIAKSYAVACSIFLLMPLSLASCSSATAHTQSLDQANTAYQQGRYAQSLKDATRITSTGSPTQRDQAHYLAGLSAKALGRHAQAITHLSRAARSTNQKLSADALSNLGLTYTEAGRFADAAHVLQRAGDLYVGDDRAQALLHAGIAQQKLGHWSQARNNLMLAQTATTDPGLTRQINDQLAVTGYTLQLGAFTQRANAQTAAQAAAIQTVVLKLGPPRQVNAKDRFGQPLILVQIGRFATYQAARRARQRLGHAEAFIVPVSER